MKYTSIDDLPREKLIELCHMYAKNWLATDGLWFQSIETKFGMDEAMEHDRTMWGKFTEIEAKRIKQFLSLKEQAGIDGLKQALAFRLYASLNEDEIIIDGNTLYYRVRTCRVQDARAKKGMAFHPCESVGIIEYSRFAKAIDDRFQTEVVSCYPHVTDTTCSCIWKFTLSADK